MSATENSRPTLPTRFPSWPGLLLGLLAAAMFAGIGPSGLLGDELSGLIGGPMAVAHGLAIAAVVTLLGEAFRVLAWDRQLQACRSTSDPKRSGWPIDAVDDACRRLYRRHSSQEQRAEIARTGDLILDRQAWTWRFGLIVVFLVPAIGFAAALWGLRIERNTIPYREIAVPLFVSLIETLPILLLALGTRGLVHSLVRQWRLLAEEVCGVRLPEGGIEADLAASSHQDHEYAPVEAVGTRPQAPPAYPGPQRPSPAQADDGGWPEEFHEPKPKPEPEREAPRKPPTEAPRKPQPEAPKKPRSNRPEDYY